jgi:hypothetical protein
VSRSGYYDWLRGPAKVKVYVFFEKVKRIYMESRKTCGIRRIKKKSAAEGIAASCKTIEPVREYTEVFYSRQRLYSANGYLSPCDLKRVDEWTSFDVCLGLTRSLLPQSYGFQRQLSRGYGWLLRRRTISLIGQSHS